ncbi:MAG: Rrf2 family transcriptional regulator [Opitutales bacterium]|nr:Rrf2 family transcriptional regulator [Opitutales bacterium]
MICYGKTASNAISAISYLAEIHETEQPKAGSKEISKNREIPKPLVAKILTILSTGKLVKGTPGPNGGYTLAKEPTEIRLIDIVTLFERLDDKVSCPFGPEWCGDGPICPLHEDMVKLREQTIEFLTRTTLELFTRQPKAYCRIPH